MKPRMIIVAGALLGVLIMFPFVAQAQQRPGGELLPIEEPRCGLTVAGQQLNTVHGKVVELYAPYVISTNKMRVKFRLNNSNPDCNCTGFKFEGTSEEVKAVFSILLTALNNCKLDVIFCCNCNNTQHLGWRSIFGLSVEIE